MLPKDHAILGTAASVGLSPWLGIYSIFFWLASIFIDIDHYIDFVWNNGFRDFSITKMLDYHDRLGRLWDRPEFLNVEIFHTVEFLGPLYLLSRYTGSLLIDAVLMGFLFHVALDMIYMYRKNAFFKRSYSIVEYYIRKRLLTRRGLDPAGLMRSTARSTLGGYEESA